MKFSVNVISKNSESLKRFIYGYIPIIYTILHTIIYTTLWHEAILKLGVDI